MGRSTGSEVFSFQLLFALIVLSGVLGRNLGLPGHRPLNLNSTSQDLAYSANFTKTLNGETLQKRAVTSRDLIRNGVDNQRSMEADAANVPQSQYPSDKYYNLMSFGWRFSKDDSHVHDSLGEIGQTAQLSKLSRPWPQGIGMATTVQELIGTQWVHSHPSDITPVNYNPTFASYTTAMDLHHGVIAASWGHIWGPERSIAHAGNKWRGGPTVPLSQWNDVVFLEWWKQRSAVAQQVNSASAMPIQYIMFVDIGGDDDDPKGQTVADAVFEALKQPPANQGLPLFEFKRTYSSTKPGDVDHFHALLGTPAGQMVTVLLSQHKRELGPRKVSDISVFGSGPSEKRSNRLVARPSLIFKIEGPYIGSSPGISFATPEPSHGTGSGAGKKSGAPKKDEYDPDLPPSHGLNIYA